jgi:hypothetical protein
VIIVVVFKPLSNFINRFLQEREELSSKPVYAENLVCYVYKHKRGKTYYQVDPSSGVIYNELVNNKWVKHRGSPSTLDLSDKNWSKGINPHQFTKEEEINDQFSFTDKPEPDTEPSIEPESSSNTKGYDDFDKEYEIKPLKIEPLSNKLNFKEIDELTAQYSPDVATLDDDDSVDFSIPTDIDIEELESKAEAHKEAKAMEKYGTKINEAQKKAQAGALVEVLNQMGFTPSQNQTPKPSPTSSDKVLNFILKLLGYFLFLIVINIVLNIVVNRTVPEFIQIAYDKLTFLPFLDPIDFQAYTDSITTYTETVETIITEVTK